MTSENTQKSRFSKYPSPITLRLSQSEIDRLDAMVSGASRSAYIRKQIFGENTDKRKYRPKTPKIDDVAVSQILAMLGASRIGNNLNQLAKANFNCIQDCCLAGVTRTNQAIHGW